MFIHPLYDFMLYVSLLLNGFNSLGVLLLDYYSFYYYLTNFLAANTFFNLY